MRPKGIGGDEEGRALRLESPDAFVGRSGELNMLHAHFERARMAEPQLVLVEGEPGMGKTSLIRHFVSQLGDVVLWEADGDESEASLEYGMITQLVGRMDAEVTRQLPLLRSGPPAPADPFAVGAELLQGAGLMQARDAVLVVVLDDLQWVDRSSARALLFTLRRLRHDRVLALLAARPEAVFDLGDGWPHLLQDRARAQRVTLSGLSSSEIQKLATTSGVDQLSTRAAERLVDHTGGHPLYVQALLEEIPRGALASATATLPTPRSLRATVISRLDALSEPARRLVGAAAVLGQRCPTRLAVTLAELTEDTDTVEEAATSSRLLGRRAGGSGEELVFVHPLIRSTVYEDLSPMLRREFHSRAARVLSGSAALAHRVAATPGCDDELAHELEDEAQREVVLDQTSGAIEHFLMASDLSSDSRSREARFFEAINVMIVAGDNDRVRAATEVIDAFAPSPAKSYVLGVLALFSGDLIDAEHHLETAVATGSADRRGSAHGRAATALAALNLVRGDNEAAAQWAQDALDAAGNDATVRVFAQMWLASGLATAGRIGEGLAVLDAPLSESAGSGAFEANLLSERGTIKLWANDVLGAIEDLQSALRRSRTGSRVRNLSALYSSLADAQYRVGEWDQALVHAELAVSLAEDMRHFYDLPISHSVAAYVHAGRGNWDVAVDHARQARDHATVAPSTTGNIYAGLAEAKVAQHRGSPDTVLNALDSCLQGPAGAYIKRMDAIPWRLLYTEALIRIERFDEAEAAVAEIEAVAEVNPTPATTIHALRLRGTLEEAKGNAEAAERVFADGHLIAGRSQLPFASAQLELAYGQHLRRAGKRRRAIGQLQSARQRFARMGARPYLERCDRELAGCGLRGDDGGSIGSVALTPREWSVAHLVASGLSNPEAAAKLYVSTKTVEYHLGNVFSKLNITSRRELGTALANVG